MSAAPAKPLGIIDRIARAESPDEVAKLAGQAMSLTTASDRTLKRINRAAVKRNKELARP